MLVDLVDFVLSFTLFPAKYDRPSNDYHLYCIVDWAWSYFLEKFIIRLLELFFVPKNYFWTIYEFLKTISSFCRQLKQKRRFERDRNIMCKYTLKLEDHKLMIVFQE